MAEAPSNLHMSPTAQLLTLAKTDIWFKYSLMGMILNSACVSSRADPQRQNTRPAQSSTVTAFSICCRSAPGAAPVASLAKLRMEEPTCSLAERQSCFHLSGSCLDILSYSLKGLCSYYLVLARIIQALLVQQKRSTSAFPPQRRLVVLVSTTLHSQDRPELSYKKLCSA